MPSWSQSHLKRRLRVPDFLLRYLWFFCGVKSSFCLFLAGCNMHVLTGAGAAICDHEVEATHKMTNQETSDDVGTIYGLIMPAPKQKPPNFVYLGEKKVTQYLTFYCFGGSLSPLDEYILSTHRLFMTLSRDLIYGDSVPRPLCT